MSCRCCGRGSSGVRQWHCCCVRVPCGGPTCTRVTGGEAVRSAAAAAAAAARAGHVLPTTGCAAPVRTPARRVRAVTLDLCAKARRQKIARRI